MASKSIVSAEQDSGKPQRQVNMAVARAAAPNTQCTPDTSSLSQACTKSDRTSTASKSEAKTGSQTQHHNYGIRHTKHDYTTDRAQLYVNNLMWQVGLLELTNAMDFPANVWNQIPTPLFAAILMGIGGSIAILWSVFPFWDMHKSLANIRLLREERRFLKQWQQEMDEKDTLETRCLVQAWLDVNFRELGWECIDRVLMDVCCGVSGVLVGTGALMALRGDIDSVFQASNLLSGYIGNSFLAPFALMNSIWAVFMWMRAGGERKLLSKGKVQIDARLQAQTRRHGQKHKLYALVNGLAAILGTVGSIMSATLWYGYVIIAPAVFMSVFSNLFWRYRMGYDRALIRCKQDLTDFDLLHTLQVVQAARDDALAGTDDKLTLSNAKSIEDIVAAMTTLGLKDAFITVLLGEQFNAGIKGTKTADRKRLDITETLQAAKSIIVKERKGVLRYRERFLIEVYGRYFRGLEATA